MLMVPNQNIRGAIASEGRRAALKKILVITRLVKICFGDLLHVLRSVFLQRSVLCVVCTVATQDVQYAAPGVTGFPGLLLCNSQQKLDDSQGLIWGEVWRGVG